MTCVLITTEFKKAPKERQDAARRSFDRLQELVDLTGLEESIGSLVVDAIIFSLNNFHADLDLKGGSVTIFEAKNSLKGRLDDHVIVPNDKVFAVENFVDHIVKQRRSEKSPQTERQVRRALQPDEAVYPMAEWESSGFDLAPLIGKLPHDDMKDAAADAGKLTQRDPWVRMLEIILLDAARVYTN